MASNARHKPRFLPLKSPVAKLVSSALSQTKLSGLTKILEEIAREARAFGCVLWQAAPDSRLETPEPVGSFFALCEWFPEGLVWKGIHIPIGSITGYTVLHRHELPYYHAPDVQTDKYFYPALFAIENDIRTVNCVPVEFKDGALGCLDVYRRGMPTPFTGQELQWIFEMAVMLPDLYETIRDEVGYELSEEASRTLQETLGAVSGGTASEGLLRETARQLAALLSRSLECLEVSIYLAGPEHRPDRYQLYGSTLEDHRHPILVLSSSDPSPIAEALRTGQPKLIADLRRLPTHETALVDRKYLELLNSLAGSDPASAPSRSPLSFMAAPITTGQRLWGSVHCCCPLAGPAYFARREVALLQLVANQIAQFVSDFRLRQESEAEKQAWRVLSRSVSSIIEEVYSELERKPPDESRVFQLSLNKINEILPGTTFTDIRMETMGDRSGLDLLQCSGEGWAKMPAYLKRVRLPAQWRARLDAKEPILLTAAELNEDAFRSYRESLPEVPHQLILAPISCRRQFGVLEIGHRGAPGLPTHAPAIGKLLGEQLGLYHDLLLNISELARAQREQRRTFQDLEHQVKTPIRHARARIQSAVRAAESLSEQLLYSQLLYLRGILAKADRVAKSIGLFADLASGERVRLKSEAHRGEELLGNLIEAAMDAQHSSEDYRNISFHVDRSMLEALQAVKVELDLDLFAQAVNCVLDNAGKYSFEGTRVTITPSVTKTRFVVAVSNQGIRIAPEEVPEVVKRGWRSALARHVVGEGTGIGLWIVDQIMRAHKGDLTITPTAPDHWTEVRLAFPLGKGSLG